MAQISFLAGESFSVTDLGGSGLGFYGDAGFGASVPIAAWQGRTFITNGAGTVQGPECDNIKYTHPASGIIGQTGNSYPLTSIPQHQATLNIRFTHTSAVKLQNSQVRIFDRSNINNPASGVTTKTAQLIHFSTVIGAGGSGDTTWVTPGGSGVIHNLTASPGTSGLSPNGANTSDAQHDYYLAISASPDSVGSKVLYGLSVLYGISINHFESLGVYNRYEQQAENKSNNKSQKIKLSAFGEEKTLLDWSKDSRSNVTYKTLKERIVFDMPTEDMITKPSERATSDKLYIPKVGDKLYHLEILEILGGGKARMKCECGNECVKRVTVVKSGKTVSCNCIKPYETDYEPFIVGEEQKKKVGVYNRENPIGERPCQ